ncbi:peptide chain release factor 1 [Rhodobacterales bacterium HTCC2150]|nr:peptide chain release factor 1 [Rhodobacterales bacterium HTCC2150] [Rhodobacteraceae bacterium HTCC2150]
MGVGAIAINRFATDICVGPNWPRERPRKHTCDHLGAEKRMFHSKMIASMPEITKSQICHLTLAVQSAIADPMVPMDKLYQITARFEFLEAKLASGETDNIVELSREYSELKPVADQIMAFQTLVQDIDAAEAMLDDPEMRELAAEELKELRDSLPDAENAIKLVLLPKDTADARPAIIEIRPGTGGDEAALFAGDLLRMYQRYAESNGWKFEIIEEQVSELGGIKEIIANIKGTNVFGKLKFESGVHRVQRVPTTESGGRIHTSAATVAVLPEAEEVDLDIPASDLRIDTMRASGAGGQHVNTTDSAVRITHLPTGMIVVSMEKSQHRNREIAMQVMRSRLYEMERQKVADERAADRKSQVGSGDRSERIRTYNFPQGRMTDHRINLTLYKLDQVMSGELDEIIDALHADDQAQKLAELDA